MENMINNKQNIFDYIKSQKWFFGIRVKELLLFYSAKRNNHNKYIKKEYGIGFAETLFIPLKKNYPIRIFNLSQAKKFHEISNKKILKNSQILISYIEKNKLLYQKINTYSKKLILTIEKDNQQKSIELFNKILSLYEIAIAQFIIIFSLGFKLAENKDILKNIDQVIKKHNTWRNGLTFKEESMNKSLFYFFKFLTTKKKLKISPLLLMKFLTLKEAKMWLDEKLTDAKIKNIIKTRRNNGFIYLNLRNNKREIVDNPTEVSKIQKYFLELDKETKKLNNKNEIFGQVAYNSNTIVREKVIIIKDKSELKNKSHLIDNKILVAIQTTPHYIQYLKKAKAIITDEGGLTCHAAILSREMKKPCIIGTKIATSVLKDGDLIEVDANKGMVTIINKK
ncbi:MAG: PEP-utilizing enzyme [Patescibacteria group bacterium]